MKKRTTALLAAVAATALLAGAPVHADDDHGKEGCERSEYRHDRHHKKGWGWHRRSDLDLNAAQAKEILEGRIARMGSKRLRVGEVEADGDKRFIAQIVTPEGALVERVAIDRDNGRMRFVE